MSLRGFAHDPLLFVVSGPSGAGKGTCLTIIADRFPDIRRAATYTTRGPRPGERDGVDYVFISQSDFDAKVATGDIYEYTVPYRDYQYGSPRELLTRDDGTDLVVELDFRGMLRTRSLSTRRVVSIFILPPTTDTLVARIGARHPEANMDARVFSNSEQLEVAWAYDYLLVNDTIENLERSVTAVVTAELLRRDGVETLARLDERIAVPAGD